MKVTDVSSISSSVGLSNETFAAKRLTSPRGKLLSKVQGSQKMFALILNDRSNQQLIENTEIEERVKDITEREIVGKSHEKQPSFFNK